MPRTLEFAYGAHRVLLDVGPLDAWRAADAWLLAALALLCAGWLARLSAPRQRLLGGLAFGGALALTLRFPLPSVPWDAVRVAGGREPLGDGTYALPAALYFAAALVLSLLGPALLAPRARPPRTPPARFGRELRAAAALALLGCLALLPLRGPGRELYRWRRALHGAPRLPELRFEGGLVRLHAGQSVRVRPTRLLVLGERTTRILFFGGAAVELPERDAVAWGLRGPAGPREFTLQAPPAEGRFGTLLGLRWGPLRVELTLEAEALEERGDRRFPLRVGIERRWVAYEWGPEAQPPSAPYGLRVTSERVAQGFHRYLVALLQPGGGTQELEVEGLGGQWRIPSQNGRLLLQSEELDGRCSMPPLGAACYCSASGPLQGPVLCLSSRGGPSGWDTMATLGRLGLALVTAGISELGSRTPLGGHAPAPTLTEVRLTDYDGRSLTREQVLAALPDAWRARTLPLPRARDASRRRAPRAGRRP